MSGYYAAATITRPNNTDAYGAADVIGSSTSASSVLRFEHIGPEANHILITGAMLRINSSAVISGETSYRLELYRESPPSAYADAATWDLDGSDRAYYVGTIDFTTLVDKGSTLICQVSPILMPVRMASDDLYGYLVTVGAHTPAANRVYAVELHSVMA